MPLLAAAAAFSAGLLPHSRQAAASPEPPSGPPASDAVCPIDLPDSLGLTPLPSVETSDAGWTPGSFAVTSSGEATYTLPLAAPPGRLGMAPSLAITYSSGGGDGPLGRGFSLSGLSRVTRCVKNLEIDGEAHAIANDDSDAYCLDGSRLLLIDDQGDIKEYRTIPDSHVRVRSVNTGVINGPTYFEVDEPSGLRKWYGTTNGSRAMARTGYAAGWALAEINDRHNNGIQYEYVNVTRISEEPVLHAVGTETVSYTAEQRIWKIHYTSPNPQRSVEFDYDDLPAMHSFSGQMDFTQSKRLKTISMFGPNHELVRDYNLGYKGDDLPSSKLEQVQECAIGWSEGSNERRCLAPTKFEWEGGAAEGGFQRVETSVHVDDADAWALADVNGDGLDDVVLSEWTGIMVIRVALGTGDPERPFQDPAIWLQTVSQGGVNARYDILPADVDNDGRTDLVLQRENDESTRVEWLRSIPATGQWPVPHFELVTTSIPRDPQDPVNNLLPGENGLKLGDFDGDGVIDVLRCHRNVVSAGTASSWQPGDSFNVQIGENLYSYNEEMLFYRNEGDGLFAAGTYAFPANCPGEGSEPVAPMFGDGRATVLRDYYFPYQIPVPGTPYSVLLAASDVAFSAMRLSPTSGEFESLDTGLETHTDLLSGGSDNVGWHDDNPLDQGRRPLIADFNGDGALDAMVLAREMRECQEGEEGHDSTMFGQACWDTRAVVTFGESPASDYDYTGPSYEGIRVGQSGSIPLSAPRSIVKKLIDQAIAFHNDDDTKADVLFPLHGSCGASPGATCYVVLRSTGDLAAPFQVIPTDIPYRWEKSPGEYEAPRQAALLPADVDGNGRADLVVLESTNDLAVYRKAVPLSRVTRIIDGRNPRSDSDPKFVPSVEIEYGPLVDRKQTNADLVAFGDENTSNTQPGPKAEDLYQARWRSPSCAWPVACVAGTRQVVSKYRVPDGLEGRRAVAMLYRDGRYDVSGHRWLGFGAVMRVDLDTLSGKATFANNEQYDTNLKVYPFAGVPSSTWEWTPALSTQPNSHQLELAFTGTLHAVVPTVGGSYFRYSAISRAWTDEADFDPGLGFYQLMEKVEQESLSPTSVLTDQTQWVLDVDGFGNALSELTQTKGVPGTTSATHSYDNNTTDWILGRERHRETCSTVGLVTQCRDLWQWHDSDGLLQHSRVGDMADPTTVLHTWLTRDPRGNIVGTVLVDGLGEKRSACSTWDAEGVFVLGTNNSEALETRSEYSRGLGVKVVEQDPNGLFTRWAVDGFGRIVRQVNRDKTEVLSSLARAPGCGDDGQAWCTLVTTETTGGSWQQTWSDGLGRTVRTLSAGSDVKTCTEMGVCEENATIAVDEEYDHLGRRVRVSRPRILDDSVTPKHHEEIAYDAAGREVSRLQPEGLLIETTYAGLRTVRSDGVRLTVTQRDGRGRITDVTEDPVGTETAYEYGPFGVTTVVQINGQSAETTTTIHDAYGRVIEHHDPDQGTTTTLYNGYGEPRATTDALGRTVTLTRDGIGRVIVRQDDDGTSVYEYDTAPNGKGRPAAQTLLLQGTTVNERRTTYDEFGRIAGTTMDRGGEIFASEVSYDEHGRPFELSYPDDGSGTRFKVKNVYDSRGNLEAVDGMRLGNGLFEIPGYQRLWQLRGVHPSGQTRLEEFGNGVETRTDINPATGAIAEIETLSPAQFGSVQALTYDYDTRGNLQRRGDTLQNTAGVITGVSEWFEHDALGRLTCTRVAEGDFEPQGPCALAVDYKPNGNIDSKSDVGDYSYGDPAHPHAVTITAGAAPQHYLYDAVGNQTNRGPDGITYTARNKPHTYTREGAVLARFEYTASGERLVKELAASSDETLWFENMYERRTDGQTGAKEHRYHVFSRDRVVVDVVRKVAPPTPPVFKDATEYQHVDHLGSLNVVTDDTAAVKERVSFDAFGRRRDPEWLNAPGMVFGPLASMGFTGQGEDHEIGVIDMRARLYDPLLGRFLNVDPHVTNPLSAQSWNAYSYVRNRPTVFVDPTGMDDVRAYTDGSMTTWAGSQADGLVCAPEDGVGAVVDNVAGAGSIVEQDGSMQAQNGTPAPAEGADAKPRGATHKYRVWTGPFSKASEDLQAIADKTPDNLEWASAKTGQLVVSGVSFFENIPNALDIFQSTLELAATVKYAPTAEGRAIAALETGDHLVDFVSTVSLVIPFSEVGLGGPAPMNGFLENGGTVRYSRTATAIGDDQFTIQNYDRSRGAAGHDLIVHATMVEGRAEVVVNGSYTHTQQIADALLGNPAYRGGPVQLCACYGACGLAQDLEAILGAPVTAYPHEVQLNWKTGILERSE